MVSTLYKRMNYLLDIPYVTSSFITEYDLSKANISALKYERYLSDEDYSFLYSANKMYREIYIGNLEKGDKSITKIKQHGIEEARRLFFEANQLQDNEILSIKNDAIFVIGTKQLQTQFGIFDFKRKNTYSFFMSTKNRLEIYYYYDPVSGNEVFDVKGINDSVLLLHQDYMISFLCQIFYMIQTSTLEDTIRFYNEFYESFINRRLDIGYYREFNAGSKFRVISKHRDFGFDYPDPSYLPIFSLDCNIQLLRDVYSVIADIYFRSVNSR